jgi:hypothetical protein
MVYSPMLTVAGSVIDTPLDCLQQRDFFNSEHAAQ